MKKFALGAGAAATAGGVYYISTAPGPIATLSADESRFMSFIAEQGRSYGTKEEYNFRFALFATTLRHVEALNANPNHTFTAGLNKFADYTAEEKKKLTGYRPNADPLEKNVKALVANDLPAEVDWNVAGGVTAVKDQKKCGSCWAFSTTGSMEGSNFINYGELVSMSEQQLVDCSWMNEGCNGGSMDYAFKYTQKHPLPTEAEYPYRGHGSLLKCKQKKHKGKFEAKAFTDVPHGSVEQLAAAVAQQPVSIAVEADQPAFQQYTGGVMNDVEGCGTTLDHGVLVVGYGHDAESNQDFWLVKNSWGADWGVNGFIKLLKAEDGAGTCGILMNASYPSVTDL